MYNKIIGLIFILWAYLHIYMLQINQIVKTSIWFENIKLINEFKNLSIAWVWDFSIWFLYSLLIAPFDIFIKNTLLSAQIVNIILLIFSWILLFNLWKKYLHPTYNTLAVILFFISSNIITYTNNINEINLTITLILLFILLIHKLLSETSIKSMNVKVHWINVKVTNNKDIIKKSIFVWIGITLLFFTIQISIVLLISILFLLIYFLLIKKLSFKILLISYSTIILTFLIFISPYIYIWWMKSYTDNNLLVINNSKIINSSWENIFLKNEKDFFSIIFPRIILGNIMDSYNDISFIFYNNKIFFIIMIFPILFFIIWIYKLLFDKRVLLTEKRYLLPIFFSLFTLINLLWGLSIFPNNYFIILLPIIILITCFGAQNIIIFNIELLSAIKFLTISFIFISIYAQWTIHYFTYNFYNDNKYEIIKEMGLWLKDNKKPNIKIMETTPIVSYYSWENKTFALPKTDKIEDIISYAKENKITYLVIDSLLLSKNNPWLKYIENSSYKNNSLEKIKEVKKIWQKVILYKFKY